MNWSLMNVFVRAVERGLNQKDASTPNSDHLSVKGITSSEAGDGQTGQPQHDVPYFRFVVVTVRLGIHV